MPKSEDDLLQLLDELNIAYNLHRHPAVHTVADSQLHCAELPGGHCKCLFVKDKKGRLGLFVVDENRRVDLKTAANDLGLGRLSFASADKMVEMLGVVPGAVTPFALINCPVAPDAPAPLIVALDEEMLNHNLVNYHPLHNEATLAIAPLDLIRFITHLGHKPVVYAF